MIDNAKAAATLFGDTMNEDAKPEASAPAEKSDQARGEKIFTGPEKHEDVFASMGKGASDDKPEPKAEAKGAAEPEADTKKQSDEGASDAAAIIETLDLDPDSEFAKEFSGFAVKHGLDADAAHKNSVLQA